jgi:hypothetical protein
VRRDPADKEIENHPTQDDETNQRIKTMKPTIEEAAVTEPKPSTIL